jgi:hypothetical protein
MNWKDINFKQYKDLMYFYENIDQYDNDLDKTIGLLVIFHPMIDIDELYSLPFIEIQKMVVPILEVLNTKITYETLPSMKLEEMTYGEWINLEIFIKEGDFQSIFDILYKDEKIDLSVKSPVYILESYENLVKYRNDIYAHFGELFKLGGDDTVDPDETPEEREERLQIEDENKNNSEWSWYLYTYDIAKGDITKFDEIFEKNHLFIFNILHMKKKFKLNEVYKGIF